MVSIHNYEQRFKRTLKRIEDSKEISERNKTITLGFKDYLLSEGIGLAKIERYLGDIQKFNRFLGKQFDKANQQDIRRVVSTIHQEPLSEQTKRCFKIMVRKLYCFIRKADRTEGYPDEVRWMKMELKGNSRKLPEELLNEDEIRRVISACTCSRDRALIATLAESGCRVSEVGLMKIKHLVFEGYGTRISISGKTGARKVLIINSTPYLQEWVNSHPLKEDPDSFLWCKSHGELMTYSRILAILKNAAVQAGIKKRVHPHLLRHSRATQLANIMSDSQLKNYLGWTQGSKMAGIYVHMSGKDTDDAILKVNNIKIETVKKDPALRPTMCARCKATNPSTNRFCNVCGFILDSKEAEKLIIEENKEKDMSSLLTSLLQDKEVVALLQRKMAEVAQ